ncbi:MAG TPA: carboxypeptidase regulatory-like domain-containing protein [Thermoanaerobaculia bacterium]|nr:carboxypeptidase regulatory-like domain-containing protein [Thermoanaerobaculia bacterium]
MAIPKVSARVLCLAALLFAAIPAGRLAAQSSTGSMSGVIVDSSGGGVPGAAVSLRSADTGAVRTTTSGANGSFTFPYLIPGNYAVTAELSGFSPAKIANVTVTVGGDATVRMVLEPAGVQAAVTVSSEAPLIETTKTEVSSVVDEKLVKALPSNGRNFLDFVLDTPGVVKDNFRVGDLVFAGQRGTLNSIVVDGTDNNNTFFGQALGRTGSGRAPYQFSLDSVKEFQVNSNSYSAEYGRAGGAVINVVTKSGTNEFHGNAFYFYRDDSLNAKNYIDAVNGRAKAPYHFDQFGATVGGPIIPDKLFFFANYDGQRNRTPNTVILTIPPGTPNDPATIAGIAKLTALAGNWNQEQNQDVFLFKTDYEIASGQHLSLRYNRQKFTGVGFESSGSTVAFEHSGDSLVNTDTVAGSIASSFTANFFNELRGQWAKDREPGTAYSNNPEAIVNQSGSPVLTIGENFFSPRETTIDRWQIADTATWLSAAHTLKGGFDYQHDNILNFFPGNFFGSYFFTTIASFNGGKPSGDGERYVQAFAGAGTTGPTTNPNLQDVSLFALDEWRLRQNLTLNLGLRYDFQKIEQPSVLNTDPQLLAAGLRTNQIPEDHNNIAPRVGIAWSPGNDGRTLIRAGYGIFYGRTTAIMVGTAHSNNGINVTTLTFTGKDVVPTYPNRFTTPPAGGTTSVSIFVFDPQFKNPMVHQASAGIERALTNDMAIALNYLFVKGQDLPRTTDLNLGAPANVPVAIVGDGTATVKRFTGTKPFTNFGRVLEFQSSADSKYNGLTVELNKRFSHNWQAKLAYTFSKVSDNKPDATTVVPQTSDDAKFASDPTDFGADWAPGDNDVRHRITLSGLWNMDYAIGIKNEVAAWFLSGWTLSGVVTFQTGAPYSLAINGDLNNDGNNRNDRVPGTDRNQERLPSLFSVDPRISKHIPVGPYVDLELIIEAFNVFNAHNVIGLQSVQYRFGNNALTPNTLFLIPCTGGQGCTAAIAASTGPRIVQLAAKVSF